MPEQRPRRPKGGDTKTPPAADEPRYAPECYACPIGTVSMAVQRVRPETNEHLFRAGKELVLALRGLLDGVTELLTTMEDRSQGARASGVERIDIRRE